MGEKVLEQQQLEQDAAEIEALNMRLSWVSRRRMQIDLDAYGLTLPQYMAMRCMQENEQGCSMSDLAEASHQVSATMTGIIDRLADRGLVARNPDPRDRRALRVVLTPAGHELLQQVAATKRELTLKILSELSGEERRAMIDSTRRYLEVMEHTVRSA